MAHLIMRTQTQARVCGFHILFSTPWLFFIFFFRVYQIRFGNVLLLNTWLLSGIWLCRCENDGVLWLLTLEMWFLALQWFTMALFLLLPFLRVYTQVEAIVKRIWILCSSVDLVTVCCTSKHSCWGQERNSKQMLFQCLSLWCPLFFFSLQLKGSHIHSFFSSSSYPWRQFQSTETQKGKKMRSGQGGIR